MQYIGRLMRDIDPAPLRDALALGAGTPARARPVRALERWRDRVLHEPDGLQAFVAAYPSAPRDALSRSSAEARDEQRARRAAAQVARAVSGVEANRRRCLTVRPSRSPPAPLSPTHPDSTMDDDRPILIGLVSISDRASAGVYDDQGLPGLTAGSTPH